MCEINRFSSHHFTFAAQHMHVVRVHWVECRLFVFIDMVREMIISLGLKTTAITKPYCIRRWKERTGNSILWFCENIRICFVRRQTIKWIRLKGEMAEWKADAILIIIMTIMGFGNWSKIWISNGNGMYTWCSLCHCLRACLHFVREFSIFGKSKWANWW